MDDMNIWVEKYRPENINDLLLTDSVKEKFKGYLEDSPNKFPNFLFVGPPGTGKTTLAKVISKTYGVPFIYINMAKEGNIETMKTTVTSFASSATLDDSIKIIIGDEADGISAQAQKSFNGIQESVYRTTRFIFTCNYPERIIPAIKSRLKEVYFSPIDEKVILKRLVEILKAEKIVTPKEQIPNLIRLVKNLYPDIRKTINNLQYFSSSGTLKIDFDELMNEDVFQKFCEVVKHKKLSEVRELLKNNRIDYDGVMKEVFHKIINDNSPWVLDENKKAEVIVQLNQYLNASLNSITDKEINFTAWSIDLMQTIGR